MALRATVYYATVSSASLTMSSVIVIILTLAICYLLWFDNILWISLLSIKITVFDCGVSLFVILSPQYFGSPRCKWGVLIPSLFLLSALSVHCVAHLAVVSQTPSDSLVLAYSGIKHTVSLSQIHHFNPLSPFSCPLRSSAACRFSPPSKPYLNLKPSYPQRWNRLPTTASSLPIFFSLKGISYRCNFSFFMLQPFPHKSQTSRA